MPTLNKVRDDIFQGPPIRWLVCWLLNLASLKQFKHYLRLLYMKKTILIIGLILNSFMLFAQDMATAKKTDSINNPPKLATATLKKTDGTSMLPANDIAANIARSPELSAFYKAIQAAGLNETFKSRGPFTVFAPNNQAFGGSVAGKLDTLQRADHKYDLLALITYHSLPGIVTVKDITHAINSNKGMATFITLTGSKLMAKFDANRNIVLVDENGGQSVISKFDLVQSNGLIHIINSVLIPRFKNL
jgi:uncharacterized surface protein with fasciclin (FAS1) repeats